MSDRFTNARKTRKIAFVTFYPGLNNILLTKDVGMIPWILHRNFGYDSYIICYRNENSYDLEKTPGLKLLFMRRIRMPLLDTVRRIYEGSQISTIINPFLMLDALFMISRMGRSISVLQLYHFKLDSMILGLIYRMFNWSGILWVKSDTNSNFAQFLKVRRTRVTLSIDYVFFKLARFDILSVETKSLTEIFRTQTPFFRIFKKVCYIPNGIDLSEISNFAADFKKKDNLILHVGRIGSYQKNSEAVLWTFAQVAENFPKWKLVLIGPMESKFERFYDKFLKTVDSALRERISYLGLLSRKELLEYMGEAKILAMPSRWEGFSLASLEATAMGCVILGSDISSLREITNNGELGYLCRADDFNCFVDMLGYILSHDDELASKSEAVKEFIRSNYNWQVILEGLNGTILEILTRRAKW